MFYQSEYDEIVCFFEKISIFLVNIYRQYAIEHKAMRYLLSILLSSSVCRVMEKEKKKKTRETSKYTGIKKRNEENERKRKEKEEIKVIL